MYSILSHHAVLTVKFHLQLLTGYIILILEVKFQFKNLLGHFTGEI